MIYKYKFTNFSVKSGISYRPLLPIEINNPENNEKISTLAMIDTGADECCIPHQFAILLGHKLFNVNPVNLGTVGGVTKAYPHSTKINIIWVSHNKKEVIHSINNAPVNYVKDIKEPLLGIKNFLEYFEIKINYPKKYFTLEKIK